MLSLAAACAAFIGIHVLVSGTPLRGRLVAAIGEGPYRGLFSLASAAALIWMGFAYGRAAHVPLWDLGSGARHLAAALMLVAVYLVVAGLATRNPTAVGQKIAGAETEPARGVIRITRHPFLWGVALWGIAHLLANGHLAGLLLFGSLTLLALVGPHLIDAKLRARAPDAWRRLAEKTSWLPFAAIAQGRNRLAWRELGWWQPLLALALYLVLLLWLHELAFGLAPLPA
jgi:uncharacterized membrane protein